MTGPRTVALIVGSRALYTVEALLWASGAIARWTLDAPLPDRVLLPDGGGASIAARGTLKLSAVSWDLYRLTGAIEQRGDVVGQWHDGGALEPGATWHGARAKALAAAAAEEARAGASVRVLVLHAPWRDSPDVRLCASRARDAGLDVTELTCPAAYGPPTPAPATTTTATEETAP